MVAAELSLLASDLMAAKGPQAVLVALQRRAVRKLFSTNACVYVGWLAILRGATGR